MRWDARPTDTHRRLLAALLVAVGLAGCERKEVVFGHVLERFVVLPDTQCYARYYPEILQEQSSFVASLLGRSDVLHVAHVGDVTDLNSATEWSVARDAFSTFLDPIALQNPVSATIVTGNHDLGQGGNASSRISGYDSALGDLLAGTSYEGSFQNSTALVGEEWLFVGLEFAPRAEVVAWASRQIAAHPTRLVAVVTHAYLAGDGERYGAPGGPQQAFHPDEYEVGRSGLDGEELWNALLRIHDNVRLVVSGHVPGQFIIRDDVGDNGNRVTSVLIDFQQLVCSPVGEDGQGYLLVLEHPSSGAEWSASVYSPWTGERRSRERIAIDPL